MRPRHIHEIQRRERRDAGADFDDLDAQEHQRRPHQVGQLRGHEQEAERHFRRGLFCGKRDCEMTDEHCDLSPMIFLLSAKIGPPIDFVNNGGEPNGGEQ